MLYIAFAVTSASKLYCRLRQPVFVWAFVALIAELVVELYPGAQAWPLYVTLLPIVPMLFFVVALRRAVERLDEMQRQICLHAALLTFLLTIVATLVFAALDRAHLYAARWDDVGTAMMFLWGCCYVFSAWRYR